MENMNLKNIRGKNVLIVGLGKSGIAAAQAMLKLDARVAIQDSKGPDQVCLLYTSLEGISIRVAALACGYRVVVARSASGSRSSCRSGAFHLITTAG